MPEGESWYVLRRDTVKNYVEIWNPNTAEVFNFDLVTSQTRSVFGRGTSQNMNQRMFDPQCTLKKIWCVVGQENVWANIQREEAPVLLRFDLYNSRDWRPFLDSKLRKEFFGEKGIIPSVQTNAPALKYQPPRDSLSSLEDQIKKFLAGKFEDERIAQVKKTTNWNIQIGEDLKKVLVADK